jgi:hypothetical protein
VRIHESKRHNASRRTVGGVSNRKENRSRTGRPRRTGRRRNLHNGSTRAPQEGALKWAEGEWIKTEEHKGPGDSKKGKGENEITYVKKIRLTKVVEDGTHEWTMIELRKRNKAREQNVPLVYKTKGPDITT